MSLHTLTAPRAPRAAFGKIVLNEARLAWRQPAGIVVGIGLSLLLLVIFGSIPVFQQTSASFGGLSAFEMALVLSIAALFAIGLSIAAAARTSGAARAIMGLAFYPLMFFSGLYVPMQILPRVFANISHLTPLGAAVQAIQDSMLGQFPPALPLLVMAAYAIVFGYLAKRFFRWE
jgi:ABC-2 type transport system permease protein